jgi:hypothetical protein
MPLFARYGSGADVSAGTGPSSGEVCGRRDHDDGQVVDRGDGAGRDTRGEQPRRQGILVEEVAQQVGGDPAVGDDRDRPGRAGQVGEECLQPRPGLPG